MRIKPLSWFLSFVDTVKAETVDRANSKVRIAEGFLNLSNSAIMNYDDKAPTPEGKTVFYKGAMWTANRDIPKGIAPDNKQWLTSWDRSFIETLANTTEGSTLPVTAGVVKELLDYVQSKPSGSVSRASETEAGILPIATEDQIKAGESKDTAVTPFWLQQAISAMAKFFTGLKWIDTLTVDEGANKVDIDVQVKSLSTPIFDSAININGIAAWIYRQDIEGTYISRELVEISLPVLKQMLGGTMTPTDPNNPTDPDTPPIKIRNFEVLDVFKLQTKSEPDIKKGYVVLDVIKQIELPPQVTIRKKEIVGVDGMDEGTRTTFSLLLYMSDGGKVTAKNVRWYTSFVYRGNTIDPNTGEYYVPVGGFDDYKVAIQAYHEGDEETTGGTFKEVVIKKIAPKLVGDLNAPDYGAATVYGWVFDKNKPSGVRDVVLYEGTNQLFSTKTGVKRQDVADTFGIPDAVNSGFVWNIPPGASINDGKAHTLTAKDASTGTVLGVQTYQLPNPAPAKDTIEYIQYRFVPNGYGIGRGDILDVQMRDGYIDDRIGYEFRLKTQTQKKPGQYCNLWLRDSDAYYAGKPSNTRNNRSFIPAGGQNLKSKEFAVDIFLMSNNNGEFKIESILATAYITTGTTTTDNGVDARFVKVYP